MCTKYRVESDLLLGQLPPHPQPDPAPFPRPGEPLPPDTPPSPHPQPPPPPPLNQMTKDLFRGFIAERNRIVVAEVGAETASRRAMADIGEI